MSEVPSFDWACTVVSVTDGDTLRVALSRDVPLTADFVATIATRPARGVAIRLITVDTPERRHPDYARARADLTAWCAARAGQLRVQTYESAGWDRLLGDVYVAGDRGTTATQHLLIAGWPPYVGRRR